MNLPPYSNFPELRTEKLLLREVVREDIPSLLKILTYDGKTAETLEEGVRISERIHQDYLDGDAVNWCIEKIENGQLIGFVGYCRGFKNGIGELGCILKEEFRGLGLMSPSLLLATEFGINQMKLKQVMALTTADNEKAIILLNRNGFSQEKELTAGYLRFVYSPK